MRLLPLLVCSGISLLSLNAEPLSQSERDYAMSYLHATRKMFLDSIAGLSDAQWNFKAAPDRWSIAECAEHIAVSEQFLRGLANQSLKSPATPEKKLPAAEMRAKDEKIVAAVPDRSQKFQAPEPIRPTHRFKSPEETVAQFRKLRDDNIDYIDKTQDDLRAHFFTHPVLGQMDTYEWYLLLAGHSERHTKQIQEVKADPGYPK